MESDGAEPRVRRQGWLEAGKDHRRADKETEADIQVHVLESADSILDDISRIEENQARRLVAKGRRVIAEMLRRQAIA